MRARPLLPTRTQTTAILIIAVVSICTSLLAASILAHEGRNVGDYNLVVGFLHEPAYEGQLNAVSLVVTKTSSGSAEDHHETASTNDHHDADAMDAEVGDFAVHGAIFTSPQIRTNEDFEFEISDEFGGVEIPYHVHPGDQEGVIVVSTEKADHGHDKSIEITDDHVVPDRIEVLIGDTVVWTNQESHSAVVMSGTLSPVTSEMTLGMSDDSRSVIDEAAASREPSCRPSLNPPSRDFPPPNERLQRPVLERTRRRPRPLHS